MNYYKKSDIPDDLIQYFQPAETGSEATPEEYVAHLVKVFREVRRVLRDDGCLWLNLGDCYAGSWKGVRASDDANRRACKEVYIPTRAESPLAGNTPHGLKPKDLVGIPWRVAFALQADGWWLRSDIIWAKPNPMPSSVTDRPTSAHEYVFLLSKRAHYYIDMHAVRTPAKEHTQKGPAGWNTEPDTHNTILREGRTPKPDKQRGHSRVHAGFNARWDRMTKAEQSAGGANLRDVWWFATRPYPEAHFATFPESLAATCIKAGTSERGACFACGAPWARVVKRRKNPSKRANTGEDLSGGAARTGNPQTSAGLHRNLGGVYGSATSAGGVPTCDCGTEETMPCLVLDPFMGSGTTAMVAASLARDYTGYELHPDYIKLIEERVAPFKSQCRLKG